MRLSTFTAAAALAAAAAVPASAAVTITQLANPTGDLPDPVSPSATVGTVFENEVGTPGTPSSGAKSPYRNADTSSFLGLEDSASYLSVQANSSATFDISGPILRILWGSPDATGDEGTPPGSPDTSRNFIQFLDGGTVFETVSAKDLDDENVFSTAKFAPAADGFAYADIDPGQVFDQIRLVNSGPLAFEVDGLAAVPLPAAAWLMIGGLGAIGAYARRARKAAAA